MLVYVFQYAPMEHMVLTEFVPCVILVVLNVQQEQWIIVLLVLVVTYYQ